MAVRPPLVSIVFFASRAEIRPMEVLEDLLRWRESSGIDVELVIAVDGGRGALFRRFQERVAGMESVRIIALNTPQGQLATIRAGISVCQGEYIVTFPAYPQVDPVSIPDILAPLREDADYVLGYRGVRRDSVFNKAASRLFNSLVRRATGFAFRDVSCGVHATRRDVARAIPNYGDNQVFLPILAAREGYRIAEVPVRQDPTEPRIRVFSPALYARRLLSLVSIAFLMRFTQKPLRPFGALGATILLAGLVIGAILTIQRFFMGQPMAGRPMLLLALLLVTAGIQLIVLGLLGELLVYLHFRDQAAALLEEESETED